MRCKYFKIKELVSPGAYQFYVEKFGKIQGESKLWAMLDERLLETLDSIREHFNREIIVNSSALNLRYRGLRLNKDEMIEEKDEYCGSAHCLGKAIDFHVKGLSTIDVYCEILNNRSKFHYIRRIENIKFTKKKGRIGWIHIDVLNIDEKFKVFNP